MDADGSILYEFEVEINMRNRAKGDLLDRTLYPQEKMSDHVPLFIQLGFGELKLRPNEDIWKRAKNFQKNVHWWIQLRTGLGHFSCLIPPFLTETMYLP